jgi:hypothetical protein
MSQVFFVSVYLISGFLFFKDSTITCTIDVTHFTIPGTPDKDSEHLPPRRSSNRRRGGEPVRSFTWRQPRLLRTSPISTAFGRFAFPRQASFEEV